MLPKTPTTLQIDPLDCATASLRIILAYYGKEVSLSQLRKECQITPKRLKLSHVTKTAKKHGLDAAVRRVSAEIIQTSIQLPTIAFWDRSHYLVIEGFQNGTVYLNDPMTGHRTIGKEQFLNSFSNLIIDVKRGSEFGRINPQPQQISIEKDPLIIALRRGVQGDILAAPHEALHQYERNFGGMIRHTPRIVVRAICEQDIIHVLQTAQTNSVPVTIRGAGHSCMGQALSDDGILLVNAAAHASFTLLENGRVEITTRCRWKYVERILNQIGLTAPVLGDNLSITIGGILSVGGYGVRSVAYGAIVHQVERLRFIQPDGSPIWCSPTENTELFQYSLAGQGRIGFIERVVMRTIPYPRQTQHYTFKHTSLDSLVKSLAWLLNDAFPEEFIAIYSRAGTIVSHYEFSLQNIPANPIQQLSQGDKLQQTQVLPNISPIYRQLQITSDEFNPAVDYLIEYAQLQPFLDFIKDKLHQTCLGQYTDSFIVMAVRPPANQHPLPFEATAFGSDPIKFLVGFYPVVPKENIRALEKVKAIIRDILHLCIKLGGRPYLYGWHELDVQVKRKLYGTHYDAVLQLQQKLDPKNLFNKKVI